MCSITRDKSNWKVVLNNFFTQTLSFWYDWMQEYVHFNFLDDILIKFDVWGLLDKKYLQFEICVLHRMTFIKGITYTFSTNECIFCYAKKL